MYNCRVCQETSTPGAPLLRHITYRRDGQISREVPVCLGCMQLLHEGVPFNDLVKMRRKVAAETVPPVSARGPGRRHSSLPRPVEPISEKQKTVNLGEPIKLLGRTVAAKKA